jgi:hypothetical protein
MIGGTRNTIKKLGRKSKGSVLDTKLGLQVYVSSVLSKLLEPYVQFNTVSSYILVTYNTYISALHT